MKDLTEGSLLEFIEQMKAINTEKLVIKPTRIIVPPDVKEYLNSIGIHTQEQLEELVSRLVAESLK